MAIWESCELKGASRTVMADLNRHQFRRNNAVLFAVIVVCFSLVIFYITVGIAMLHRAQTSEDALAISGNFSNAELNTLFQVLKTAAMEDGRTVLLAPLNSAWADSGGMFDIFLEGFRFGDGISHLLNHLVIVALDRAAYTRCIQSHSHCFELTMDGVDLSGEQLYMSEEYVKMNKRRLFFQGIVLELGFNFIFTDIDIVWLRSPFPHFQEGADFQVTCDRFSRSTPNMGLVYARSNERTIQFFKYWHEQNILHPDQNEQEVFSSIRHDPEFQALGVRLEYLSTVYFGGFCEKRGMDISKVCTMHANCCKGTMKKQADLRLILEDWKRFKVGRPVTRFRAPRQCRKSLIQYLQ